MDAPDADNPPVPHERSAAPSAPVTGCVIVCVFALLPVLYVGSFAYVILDDWFQWGFVASLDGPALDALELFYWPLLWLLNQAVTLTS